MSEPNLNQSSVYLLGQIDAKVTHLLSSFATQKLDNKIVQDELHLRINLQAERLDRVERRHWKTAGVMSLIPLVFTLAGLVIAYLNMKT
jgi:hypothetical protein